MSPDPKLLFLFYVLIQATKSLSEFLFKGCVFFRRFESFWKMADDKPDKSQHVVSIEQGREVKCFRTRKNLGEKEPDANTPAVGFPLELPSWCQFLWSFSITQVLHLKWCNGGRRRRGHLVSCLNKLYTQSHQQNHSLDCILASDLRIKGFLFPLETLRAIHSPYHMFTVRNRSSKLNKNYCAAYNWQN